MKNEYRGKLKRNTASVLCFCTMGSLLLNTIPMNAYAKNKAVMNLNQLQTTIYPMALPTEQMMQDRELSNSAVVIDQLFYYFKNAKPVMKDNQVFVPVEEFAAMLHYTITWNQEKTVVILKNIKGNILTFTVGVGEYLNKDEKYPLSTPCYMQSFNTKEYLMVEAQILSSLVTHYSLYQKDQVQLFNYTYEELFVLTTDKQEALLRMDFNYPREETTFDCFTSSLSPYSKKALSLSQINKKLKKYGKMINDGLSLKKYKEVMTKPWIDVTKYNETPSKVTIDMMKEIDYASYEKLLMRLSRYDGVYVYVIGKSTQGRNIYSITIDMGDNPNKKVFMFTGQTHAREYAGGVYILKQFADLIQKAQTDPDALSLLLNIKYVAVPIINVDAREAIINKTRKYIKTPIGLWKAYTNGTDGNRNYPGLSANQLAKNVRKNSKIKSSPNAYCYNGDYSGSNKETQAMMKWIYYYVVEEKASYLGDYHMQGRLVYGGKPWDLWKNHIRNKKAAFSVLSYLNKGNYGKYSYIKEKSTYGIDGDGSTLTDFAATCALGAKYSTAYGIFVIADEKTKKEYLLTQYKDLDKFKGTFKQANSKFVTITFEVGYGASALGYTTSTRKKLYQEFKKYHYDTLLEDLPSIILKN